MRKSLLPRNAMLFLTLCLFAWLTVKVVWAEDEKAEPIGKIIAVTQPEAAPIPIRGSQGGQRAACEGCPIFEGDRLETKKQQNITILFDEGSEVTVGSESAFTVESWNQRDSNNHLRRVLNLSRGVLRTLVNKVYSNEEPFLVKAKSGVMGVRGTEFIAAVNSEQLSRFETEQTTSLYTLSGEVHFAKNEKNFHDGKYVLARAGDKSTMAKGMDVPITPKRFQMNELKKTFKQTLPQVSNAQLQTTRKFEVKANRAKAVVAPSQYRPEVNRNRGSGPNHSGAPHAQGPGPRSKGPGNALGKQAPTKDREGFRDRELPTVDNVAVEAHRAGKIVEAGGPQREHGDEFGAPGEMTRGHHPGAPGNRPGERRVGAGFDRMRPGAPGSSGRPIGSGRMRPPGGRPGDRDRQRRGEMAPRPLYPPPPPPGP